ncbi:MAG: hypothetical protein F2563_04805 [Actinobacteria bacterium]|jgi:hypothetical protein|uniref:Unannotated protein n=1 Tax=freshwater metagenome TaxID=449393 RepID=A0A6J6F238_9ZZZZ|nr:hypothetical protein [Actinomycetota bacterium]
MSDQLPLPNSPSLPISATGNADIDSALIVLNTLDSLDINEHAEVFTQIHAKLSNALTDIDN